MHFHKQYIQKHDKPILSEMDYAYVVCIKAGGCVLYLGFTITEGIVTSLDTSNQVYNSYTYKHIDNTRVSMTLV